MQLCPASVSGRPSLDQPLLLQKFLRHIRWLAFLAAYFVIQSLHRRVVEERREFVQHLCNLGIRVQRLLSNNSLVYSALLANTTLSPPISTAPVAPCISLFSQLVRAAPVNSLTSFS